MNKVNAMDTSKLKNRIHHLVYNIENPDFLSRLYEVLKNTQQLEDGDLTDEEQKELLKAFDESEDQDNLIPHDEMKAKHGK
ncbi:MAG: hypothetical protein K9I68_04490 [Bacteroidales bacterium]|nr:hypothetical protein [Bacteroidales bacterium]MCF8338212.1 hypothetical protein [Bacteroidales bacterium]